MFAKWVNANVNRNTLARAFNNSAGKKHTKIVDIKRDVCRYEIELSYALTVGCNAKRIKLHFKSKFLCSKLDFREQPRGIRQQNFLRQVVEYSIWRISGAFVPFQLWFTAERLRAFEIRNYLLDISMIDRDNDVKSFFLFVISRFVLKVSFSEK